MVRNIDVRIHSKLAKTQVFTCDLVRFCFVLILSRFGENESRNLSSAWKSFWNALWNSFWFLTKYSPLHYWDITERQIKWIEQTTIKYLYLEITFLLFLGGSMGEKFFFSKMGSHKTSLPQIFSGFSFCYIVILHRTGRLREKIDKGAKIVITDVLTIESSSQQEVTCLESTTTT